MRQRIHRVGGNQQDAFRPCRGDPGNHVAKNRRVLFQQVEARFAGRETGAHRHHNHFRVRAILKTAGAHQCGVRPRFGVADVLRFPLGFLAVAINQHNVGSEPRQQQRIGRRSAYIANTHYRNTVFRHILPTYLQAPTRAAACASSLTCRRSAPASGRPPAAAFSVAWLRVACADQRVRDAGLRERPGNRQLAVREAVFPGHRPHAVEHFLYANA